MLLGLIAGTGIGELPSLQVTSTESASTAWGAPSAELRYGQLHGLSVVFLPRHGNDHQLPPHAINYRANIRALADAGVTAIVAVAAVGGIGKPFRGGAVAVPDQLIDYSWGRAQTFWDDASSPAMHVEFEPPYDEQLRRDLLQAARVAAVDVVPEATYGVTQGPRLETAAEIRRLARDGCDIVGMTGMPEAALAREAGVPYACLAMVVNAAAGLGNGGIHDEIATHIATAGDKVSRILEGYAGMLVDRGAD